MISSSHSNEIPIIMNDLFQMSNMATIVTTTLASAKAAASGSKDVNPRGDAFVPQNII